MMLARDIMTVEVITISPSARIYELTKLLIENKISGVLVCNENGHVVGIVTEADLIDLKNGNQVGDIMVREVISVDADTPVKKVASILHAHKINRVPVYENGSLVGIITRANIIAAVAKSKSVVKKTSSKKQAGKDE
jgi:CBS domain-containing protein